MRYGVAVVGLTFALTGCGAVADRGVGGDEEPTAGRTVGRAPLTEAHLIHDAENNDWFASAQLVHVESGQPVVIRGWTEWPGDVDVYMFGPIEAGDRIVVQVEGDRAYAPTVAAFNADQTLRSIRQPIGALGGVLDITLPQASHLCYIAVAADVELGCCGRYELRILPGGRGRVRQPGLQTVLLNFSGADAVALGHAERIDIPPFAAEMIDPSLEGWTEVLIESTSQAVRNDFVGLEVSILISTENPPLPAAYSTVHFGSFQPNLLGLAERVDALNEDRSDRAVVFVDSFAAFLGLAPSPEELAQALANVASHEIGHLLGLVHAGSPVDLMDVSSDLATLLEDRWFTRSPLDPLVFPVGEQDAVSVLAEAVGAGGIGPPATPTTMRVDGTRDHSPSLGAIESGPVLSTCGRWRHRSQ